MNSERSASDEAVSLTYDKIDCFHAQGMASASPARFLLISHCPQENYAVILEVCTCLWHGRFAGLIIAR